MFSCSQAQRCFSPFVRRSPVVSRYLLSVHHQLSSPPISSFYCPQFTFSSASINVEQLSQDMNAYNDLLQKNEVSIQSVQNELSLKIISNIRSMAVAPPTSAVTSDADFVINVCFFLTQYNTEKALSLSESAIGIDPAAKTDNSNQKSLIQNLQKEQYADMQIGWNLLNGLEWHSHKSIPILKIEMATRMEDSAKIEYAFNELLQKRNHRLDDFTLDELMIAFCTVPYLGKWQVMLELGTVIEDKIPSALESLSMMAANFPIPDFTVVYDLVQEHKDTLIANESEKANANATNNLALQNIWDVFDFEAIRIRFTDVNCYQSMSDLSTMDTAKRDLILENMPIESRDWTDVDLSTTAIMNTGGSLRQMGSLCSARSFYSFGDMIPVQLYGCWLANTTDDSVLLKGKIEIPLFEDEPEDDNQQKQKQNQDDNAVNDDADNDDKSEAQPQITIIHIEEWMIKRDRETNSKVLHGTYVVKQRQRMNFDASNADALDEKMAETLSAMAPMDWIYDLEITLS